MWIVIGRPGMFSTRTRNLLVVTSIIVTNGSRHLLQKTRVPPCALEDDNAKSCSYLSSELRLQQKSVWKMLVARKRSDWNSQGSEMKMKSALWRLVILWRSYDTRLKPSQFQVKHLNDLYTRAAEESALSEQISLNFHCQECHWGLDCQVLLVVLLYLLVVWWKNGLDQIFLLDCAHSL